MLMEILKVLLGEFWESTLRLKSCLVGFVTPVASVGVFLFFLSFFFPLFFLFVSFAICKSSPSLCA